MNNAAVADAGRGRDDVARLTHVSHRYGATQALDNVSLAIPAGVNVGIIGPDGVGKSTLLGLLAGVRRLQAGNMQVLDCNLVKASQRRRLGPRVAYMPQGLGRNLYPTLSVYENIDFFAQLFNQARGERAARIRDLMDRTGLAPFSGRRAGQLSGGMKQKLALCCALVHEPEMLVLDEPTTGVDPLSRRRFWELMSDIRAQRPEISVLVSTAYIEEAEELDWLVAMYAGIVLATGTPASLEASTGQPDLDRAFVALLPGGAERQSMDWVVPPRTALDGPPAIEARALTKRFGQFTAVDA